MQRNASAKTSGSVEPLIEASAETLTEPLFRFSALLCFFCLFGPAPAAETGHAQADQQGQESQPEQTSYDKEGPETSAEVRTKALAKMRAYPEHSPS